MSQCDGVFVMKCVLFALVTINIEHICSNCSRHPWVSKRFIMKRLVFCFVYVGI